MPTLNFKGKTFVQNYHFQVEQTGREQRGTSYVHAEDVKEYLIKQCRIREEEIAVKSSEKDDIEGD
ncbi:MAG: Uncharacterized protein XD78_1111 [Desulfotomaculum sp. 46_296]|nr:MAG: Uncharacterized protein XD78_1111 [Desulfotomaculum sp. 46_296]HAU30949.1 hypothetical protein [Desulfotomaculum sp.]